MAIWDMWYIDEHFLVWIFPLTYLSRKFIIWACTTSFVHTCIYRMFKLFTACTYALHTAFYACFQFQIHQYTWFTVVPLISLMLLIIFCTRMPVPHHLIMYTCACYARHLALLYVLAGCIWQPWIFMSRSWSLDLGGLIVADQSAQRILPWRS